MLQEESSIALLVDEDECEVWLPFRFVILHRFLDLVDFSFENVFNLNISLSVFVFHH